MICRNETLKQEFFLPLIPVLCMLCVCVCVCVCVYTKLLVQIILYIIEDLKVIESLQHSTRNYHSNVYFLKNYTCESLAMYNLM